jgi:isoleucyl-tRNA synthetase
VLTYGWALDEKGRPMSKSLGNVVLPSEVCEKWGADLLRLWVAAHDYTADIWMSENVMQQLAESYRKLRNTFRFALGNLGDFDPARDSVPEKELEEFDAWMLERTAALVRDCQGWYEGFEFHRVFHALHDFAVVELSSFYFDVLKDRLYTFGKTSRARRSGQTAILRIADALLRLMAPLLVFTSEEIWKHFPKRANAPESIHMAEFRKPEELSAGFDSKKGENWATLASVRVEVLKALETARAAKQIGTGLEARVVLAGEEKLLATLNGYAKWLPALFIVSQVEIISAPTEDAKPAAGMVGLSVAIRRADGSKCERCWNYSTHVGESAKFPTVCERCLPVVESILGGAVTAS